VRLHRIPWLRWLVELYWRSRERDVDDVRVAETKGPPSYKRGKVAGLTPALEVMTETTESPFVCCGYCSAGMACWTAKQGLGPKMAATAHPIRSQGGRPHDNGSRASELRDGASRAHGVKLRPLAVDEIRDVLRDGFAVVVNLDYADLPDWLRVQGGSFGHSCTLYGIRDELVGFYDPLWPQGASGAWATWDEIRPALWADGEHSGTTTRWGTAPAPPPGPGPEPSPVDDCDELSPEQLARLELDAYELAVRQRDASWRYVYAVPQPRLFSSWAPTSSPVEGSTRWSTFARFGPEVEAGTWNGPDAAWDRHSWR